MKITHIPFRKLSFVLFSFLMMCSCSNNMEESPNPEQQQEEEEEVEEILTSDELAFLRDIAQVDKDMDQFWEGFSSARETPIFIITQSDNGILLNPPDVELPNSRPIPHELGMGLENFKAYRNDQIRDYIFEQMNISSATPQLFGLFTTSYKLMGYNLTFDITGNFYNDYKDRNGYFHPSIFYHELFHCYQFQRNDEFFGEQISQSFLEYPLNDSTLPLLLLLFDVMIDAYHIEDTDEKLKILSYYVGIQHQLNTIDPTPENYIRKHGFYLEKLEGIARYIEVFSTLYTLNNNTIDDPTHGFATFAESITEPIEVRQVYARRIFYHTGAGVIHLLKELDYPNLEQDVLNPENTPYDLAKSFLDMTETELQDALDNARTAYDWDQLIERSEYLLSL